MFNMSKTFESTIVSNILIVLWLFKNVVCWLGCTVSSMSFAPLLTFQSSVVFKDRRPMFGGQGMIHEMAALGVPTRVGSTTRADVDSRAR